MNREHHFLERRFEFNRCNGFRNQFGGRGADDVNAENLSVLCVGDDFEEAVVRVNDGGLGVSGEWKLSDLDVVALFFCLGLGKSYAGDLRLSVGAAGDAIAIHRTRVLAGQVRGDDHATHRANVSKLGHAGDDVTDGIDSGLCCLHPLIRRDEASLELNLRLLDADVLCSWSAANSDEDLLRFLHYGLVFSAGKGDLDAGAGLFDLLHFRADVDIDSALAIETSQLLADVLIFNRDEARKVFDDGHFRPEAAKDGGELDADGTRADDDQRL